MPHSGVSLHIQNIHSEVLGRVQTKQIKQTKTTFHPEPCKNHTEEQTLQRWMLEKKRVVAKRFTGPNEEDFVNLVLLNRVHKILAAV